MTPSNFFALVLSSLFMYRFILGQRELMNDTPFFSNLQYSVSSLRKERAIKHLHIINHTW